MPPFDNEHHGLSNEKFLIFLSANSQEAKKMSLGEINPVVTEGIYKLCTMLGMKIDEFILGVDPEEMSDLAKTDSGRELIRIISSMGDALVMVMESINHLRENFPEYEKNVNAFQTRVMDRIKQQEETLIKEFVDSIPDSIDIKE